MSRKVLIVDDDPTTVHLIERLLHKAGYSTVTAKDGLEAMVKVKEDRPDLVVLDVVMPELNGYEVCYQLRFNKDYRKIPVVLLTEREKELDDLITDKVRITYVGKPIHSDEFLRNVEEASRVIPEVDAGEENRLQLNIGFIGTGLMGRPMARRLLKGHQVTVYNRTPSKISSLVEDGALAAASARDAIVNSDVIILMLTDGQAIQDVFKDVDETVLSGKVILQMGTISPEESRNLHALFRRSGASYLECPVLGSKNEAREGRLILMAAGSKDVFQILRPILTLLGENPRYVGEIGQAAVLKLCLNHLIATHAAGFSLSLALSRKAGIDPGDLMNILKRSSLYTPMFEKKLMNWIDHEYDDPNFPLKHLLKDVNLIRDAAEEHDCDCRGVEAIRDLIDRAVAAGYAEKDYSSLYEAVADKNAGNREGDST